MYDLSSRAILAALARSIGYVDRFWSWWSRELLSCVPSSVVRFFHSHPSGLFLRPNGDQFVVSGPDTGDVDCELDISLRSDIDTLMGRARRADEMVLLLPASQVLRRIIELPMAARSDLATAIPFMIERNTPFREGAARYTYRNLGLSNKQTLSVELAVIARSTVEAWEAKLSALPVGLTAIRVEGDDTSPALKFGGQLSRGATKWMRDPSRLMFLGAACILLLGPWMMDAAVRGAIDNRQSTLALASAPVAEALKIQEEFQSASASVNVFHKKVQQPPAIQLLQGVTVALPDDSWIFSFDLDTATLRLSGYARDVPAVLRRLKALPWAYSIDFQSPIVHDADQQSDRFELLIQLSSAEDGIGANR